MDGWMEEKEIVAYKPLPNEFTQCWWSTFKTALLRNTKEYGGAYSMWHWHDSEVITCMNSCGDDIDLWQTSKCVTTRRHSQIRLMVVIHLNSQYLFGKVFSYMYLGAFCVPIVDVCVHAVCVIAGLAVYLPHLDVFSQVSQASAFHLSSQEETYSTIMFVQLKLHTFKLKILH